jgi:hypothetical protein
MNEIASEHPASPADTPPRGYRVSPKNVAANRQNAAHSTGPRSPEGKARSRLNALKHGLLASQAVNRLIEGDEARAQFDTLADRLQAYYRPMGPMEELMVEKVAIATWRLRRILRYEQQASYRAWREDQHDGYARLIKRLGLGEEFANRQRAHKQVFKEAGVDGVTLPNRTEGLLLMRYEAAVNRDLYRAIGELRRLRRERQEMAAEGSAGGNGGGGPSSGTGAEQGGARKGPALEEVERKAHAPRTAEEAKRLADETRWADEAMDDQKIYREYPQFFNFYQTKPIGAAGKADKGAQGAETPPADPNR